MRALLRKKDAADKAKREGAKGVKQDGGTPATGGASQPPFDIDSRSELAPPLH